MSTLLDRGPAASGAGSAPSPVGAPVDAAVRAAAGGIVPLAVPVVLAWVTGAGGDATWTQAVRFCLDLWLLAHHGGIVVTGGHLGLVPLGLAAVPLVACWYAGRRLARTMDPRADRIAAGATRAVPAMLGRRPLAIFVGTYAVLIALASWIAGMAGLRPITAQAVLGGIVVSGGAGFLGACAYRFGGPFAGARGVVARLPDPVRPCVRPAAIALLALVSAGALAVLALVAAHGPGVMALHQALGPDLVGGVVLVVGQLALLPNLALWAVSTMAGPGFSVGVGTSVTLTGSHLGPLPAVPVLAALPAPGALPDLVVALALVPVLAGVVLGVLADRSSEGIDTSTRLRRIGISLVLYTVGATGAVWLSGGPAGPGRLGDVGPDVLLTGAALGLEALTGAALAFGLLRLAPRLTGGHLLDVRFPGLPGRSVGEAPARHGR